MHRGLRRIVYQGGRHAGHRASPGDTAVGSTVVMIRRRSLFVAKAHTATDARHADCNSPELRKRTPRRAGALPGSGRSASRGWVGGREVGMLVRRIGVRATRGSVLARACDSTRGRAVPEREGASELHRRPYPYQARPGLHARMAYDPAT